MNITNELRQKENRIHIGIGANIRRFCRQSKA